MSEPFKKQKVEQFSYDEEPVKPALTEKSIEPIPEQEQVPILATGVDQSELIETYKNLLLYKNHLFKVDLLLSNEDDQDTIKELTTIKDELQPAIEASELKIKDLTNQKDFFYSVDRLKNEDINKLCKSYFEQHKKWYNAKLLSIDTDNQEADVQFIGYQEIFKLHAIYIKVCTAPDPKLFIVGGQCEAIYPGDGRYYSCTIEKITDEGYQVKFKKYNNKEILSIYHLRESKKVVSTENVDKKKMFEDLDEFIVPDNLKILPSDNEQQRQAKKKKLKALKQAFKSAQIDKYSSETQNKWQSFSQKVSQIKPDIGQKQEKIFKSSDNPQGISAMGSTSRTFVEQKQNQKFLERNNRNRII